MSQPEPAPTTTAETSIDGPSGDPRPSLPDRLGDRGSARVVLWLVGAVWAVIGAWAIGDPAAMASSVELGVESSLARLEVRAMYGGLSLALAFLHFVASTRAVWVPQALAASAITGVGLVSGRVLSIAVDGYSGMTAIILIGTELTWIASCVWAGQRLWRGARRDRKAAAAAEADANRLGDDGEAA